MARFEMTMATGETILVDHAAADLRELMSEVAGNPLVLFTEIKGTSALAAPREVIVASAQIAMVRAVDSQTRQGSSFVPKR